MPYGINNTYGQLSVKGAAEILGKAREAGLDTLDTAMAYGSSEKVLGQIGIQDWRVITKLPAVPVDCADVMEWVRNEVQSSLDRLGTSRLRGLLLHRSDQLLGPHGIKLYEALISLKHGKVVEKIGVSIYAPEELDKLFPDYDLDLVQAPLNVLDRRFITTGWLERLHSSGVEIHARSVFLQGLLLMSCNERQSRFLRWQSLWIRWDNWLRENHLTALQGCLGFVFAHADIDKVVVGVDSQQHLSEILQSVNGTIPPPPAELSCEDIDLINPSRWSEL